MSGDADKRADAAEMKLAASPWKPFEARRRERDVKRGAVLRVAVSLFLEQGYDRTSLNEVAERLNITKPALYNYFRSKEEILVECYRLGQEKAIAGIERILAKPDTGLVRLRALIRHYCEVMTLDFGQCLVRVDDHVLSAPARDQVREGKRLIDRYFRDFLTSGMEDGSIKPCDVRLTVFAITGAINWVGHWYRADGEMTAREIGDTYAMQLTGSLAVEET